LDLQLPVQSVPITTKVVSLNPTHDKVYLIQHDVIKFVSLICSRSVVYTDTPVSSDCHDITEILLKMVLNIIALTLLFLDVQ
jgi:hypothetical protein